MLLFSKSFLLVAFLTLNPLAILLASEPYSTAVDNPYPDTVFWGDTHVHSSLSWDAFHLGNQKLGPEDVYRFASGKQVVTSSGRTAQLQRSLDFIVVADHASNMGVMQGLASEDALLLASPVARQWSGLWKTVRALEKSDPEKALALSYELFKQGFDGGNIGPEYQLSVWQSVAELADQYNQPGEFTAFIGYEWTQYFYNLHRVIIFEDDADKAGKTRPFSQYDSNDVERLWDYLEAYERDTQGSVLAIPHNGNLSRGVMFALQDAAGRSLSERYAKRRSRWEPLFEVTQIKGDSESHPRLSPDDSFADFETLTESAPTADAWSEVSKKALNETAYDPWVKANNRKGDQEWMREFEYARSALKLGLKQQKRIGVNPFKFGMIGSTDSHTSLATADDNNFWGKSAWLEPTPYRLKSTWWGKAPIPSAGWRSKAWTQSASGYAGIWAQENTRESLFAAMKRKEVYATTGPRINVRFFGGWNYATNDAFRPDLARIGYSQGVPMGGDLTAAPDNASPTFLIRAVKDPDGANLDRVQVVKGWLDNNNQLHEKIYNVALSGGRQDQGSKTERVGNTVNVPDASYTNTIGDAELAVVWTDPDFDPDERAFYYLRVLEIPTPRWTAYDARYFQIQEIPEEIPMITQERAYSSPIWYSP